MAKKDSPGAKPDNATGLKPKHTQDVENTPDNKPAKAASDKDNDGKPDKSKMDNFPPKKEGE